MNNNELVVREAPMDLALVEVSASNEVVDKNKSVPGGLEECFRELVAFDNETKRKRKEIIDRVADCMCSAGIDKVLPNSYIYDKLFLWFIQHGKYDMSRIQIEENRNKFQTMYELESSFPTMTVSTGTNKQILLRASRASKQYMIFVLNVSSWINVGNRTPAENEIVSIHKKNLKDYLNLLRTLNIALGNRAAKKLDSMTIAGDSEENEEPDNSTQRDFLFLLVSAHDELRKTYDSEIKTRLEKGECLSGSVINLYLERILQPMSDSTSQNILFVPTEYYVIVKGSEGPHDIRLNRFWDRYEIENITKFIFVCHAEYHWFTMVIENDWVSGAPTITFMDSLSTKEPFNKHAKYVQTTIEVFSVLFGVEPSAWVKIVPLKKHLQSDAVNCGVWAILFAESFLQGFRTLDNLINIDIDAEKFRIAKQVESLLDWKTYHDTFTKEGVIYRKRNPESDAYMIMRKDMPGNITSHII